MHHIDDIISIFNDTFYQEFNTKLVKGEDEPIYLPANEVCDFHRIIFAHGFYASALHKTVIPVAMVALTLQGISLLISSADRLVRGGSDGR